jgi:hypothetical protein
VVEDVPERCRLVRCELMIIKKKKNKPV